MRSREVERLYGHIAAQLGGSVGTVEAEARRILSTLARGSDPSTKIRALEALAKMDEPRKSPRVRLILRPKRRLAEIAALSPLLGALLAKQHGVEFQVDAPAAHAELARLEQFVNDLAG